MSYPKVRLWEPSAMSPVTRAVWCVTLRGSQFAQTGGAHHAATVC